MPTQINQLDDSVLRQTTLRVEGDMMLDDACLLERIGIEIRRETGNRILIDLADLSFLDSDAAPYLKRLSGLDGFEISGIEIFLQSMVNYAERDRV
jgi:anti-anti-sigma regulatory factor